jgi:septum site-determining protein MinD
MPRPKPRSISICSGKGGTGKTVLTANLGIALGSLGKKVVIMDADLAMANLSIVMGMHRCEVTLFDVLKGKATLDQALYKNYGVEVLPTGFRFEEVQEMLGNVSREKVEEIISELLNRAEILLLDAAAGIQETSLLLLAAAREALPVSTPSYASLVDVYKTIRIANLLRVWTRGLILNRMGTTDLTREEVQAFMGRAVKGLPILAEIPEDPKVREAEREGVPVLVYDPSCPASEAIQGLAKIVAGEEQLPYVPVEEREIRETSRRLLAALLG